MSRTCKELERQFGDGGCKCIHYREQFPGCECENHSVSDYSLGAVGNEEIIIRTLFSPIQINGKTGFVDPVHFRHDALKRGLSVNRKDHIDEADLRAKIEAKIAWDQEQGKNRDGFYRVVTASCGRIRGIRGEDGSRLFCVYDTGNVDDASHADVCQAFDPPPETANRRSLRMKISSMLFEVFLGNATDLETVYKDA